MTLLLTNAEFIDTYFAPGHMLLSVDYEHPSVFEKLHIIAGVIEQVDFSKMNNKFHSQYFMLKAAMPIDNFVFQLSTSFEMSISIMGNEASFNTAWAWDAGVYSYRGV
jgi:hypothetical protein